MPVSRFIASGRSEIKMTQGSGVSRVGDHGGLRAPLIRSVGLILGIACVVFLVEETMHAIGFFHTVWQAIWWPTNGIAVALMVRSERREWPVILVGTLLGSLGGELQFHVNATSNLVNGAANAAGPLLAAAALPRFKRLDEWLQEPRLVLRFIVFAMLLAPLVSAMIFAVYERTVAPNISFWVLLRTRAGSDMLGYAMATPLVLVLVSRERYTAIRAAGFRGFAIPAALLAMVAVSTWMICHQSSYPLNFVLISVMLLVSVRIGFATSVIAMNLMAVLVTVATMGGTGPLVLGNGALMADRIMLLQLFLSLTMITVFSVSVMQIEREVYQTKLQLAYTEMERQATTDALTAVGNRRLFESRLESEWARAQRSGEPVAVLMIDVDWFKSYNDLYGHLAGDECLRTIARALDGMQQRSTDLLARYGGEEFVMLLPGTTLEGAVTIAEAIQVRMRALHQDSESSLHSPVAVSIGCAALVPAPGMLPNHLIGASDEALYRAKQNGRNRVEAAGIPMGIDQKG